jgi:type I restriction enzyme S subunit
MTDIQSWELKHLTDLAEYINGYAFKPEDWGQEGLPIIRIEQLKNPESISDFYSGKLHEKNIIQDGDLIFSWSASLFLRLWQYGKAALNQHLFKVVEKEWVDRIFLKHFIEYYLPEIAKASHGSTMQHITRKELNRFGALFPIDEPEQSKIAEVLSKVDQAIEQTESLIAKQQRIKTGLMQDLLTRGIDEHGNLRSEETHKFKDSPIGRIPEEWLIVRLEEVSEFVTSGSRGWARYYSKEGALFIRIGNLTREHIHMRFEDNIYVNPPQISEGKRTELKFGDLLISITADLGIVAVIPETFPEAYVNQHIALVRLNKQKVFPIFLGWFLTCNKGKSQFDKLNESGAKAGLNLPTVKNLLVPTLEIAEQKRIAKILEANFYSMRQYQIQLHKLRSLKTALMQDLLTGKIRVTPLMNKKEAST